MVWATSDSDQFNRTHVANTSSGAVEQHDHTSGKGLAAGRVNVTNAKATAGDVLVTGTDFTYRDNQGSPANHTVLTLDVDKTITANDTFSGNEIFTGTLKVPVSAGAAPTTSGLIAYDSTANAFVVGVNGTTGTLVATGVGSPVGVASGGTGRSTLTAHAVVVGEGTSQVGLISPSTSGYPMVSQGASSDPAFAQLTGAGIAAGTITAGLLASGSTTLLKCSANTSLASTSFTAITGCSQSFAAGTYLVSFTVCFQSTGATGLLSAYIANATDSPGVLQFPVGSPTYGHMTMAPYKITLGGSTTLTLNVQDAGGNAVVLQLGPAGGSGQGTWMTVQQIG